LTFYLQDSNYNVVALADNTGSTVERYWYEPYGEVTITEAAGGTQETVLNDVLLFQGQRRDPETGLYYLRNRYYSPMLGRFVQRDPAEYKDGMSFYGFLHNAPVFGSDPYGNDRLIERATGTHWMMNEAQEMSRTASQKMARIYAETVEEYKQTGSSELRDRLPDLEKSLKRMQAWNSRLEATRHSIVSDAAAEGYYHGSQIVTNSFTMGLTDAIGLTEANALVEKHGGLYKYAQISSDIGAVAAYSAVALSLSSAQKSAQAVQVAKGGRLGGPAHRSMVKEIAGNLKREGYRITGGGGLKKETFIKKSAGMITSRYADITAVKNGRLVHINVGYMKNWSREMRALSDIRASLASSIGGIGDAWFVPIQ